MKAYSPEQLGIIEQPLDSNEVGRTMIARRAFLAAMIMGGRIKALARPEAIHPLPNNGQILPPEYYAERGEQ